MSINVNAYLAEFENLALEAGFSCEVIAEVGGYKIPAFKKTILQEGAKNKSQIYLSSGCHGDEPAGVQAMLEMLRDGMFDDRLDWFICPVLNPTGLAFSTRENEQGVDMNRDYLKRQTAEVRGHVAWLERQPVPSMFISLHEDWESTGFYLYEIQKCVCQSNARAILDATSRVIVTEPKLVIDDHDVRELGWIFHEPRADFPDQWPEAIFMAERGTTVSYTLETPSSHPLEDRVRCHKAAVKTAVEELLLTQGG